MAVVRVGDRRTFDVYVGRAGRGEEGLFGNPYPVGKVCTRCRAFHRDTASTLPCFKAYLDERVATDPTFRFYLLALRHKVLFCPGRCKEKEQPCHADVIVEWLEAHA